MNQRTVFPFTVKGTIWSRIALSIALTMVAVNMLKMVMPTRIHSIANIRPTTETGVLSPYLLMEKILKSLRLNAQYLFFIFL